MPDGLPSLPLNILGSISTLQADVAGLGSLLGFSNQPVYGIFLNGSPALTGYNSVIGFGFTADEQIPVYPIEQGGFQSYNKVALPFGAKLQYTVNGGQQQIQAFVTQLEAIRQDTNLYTVVTPVYSWQNTNGIHWDVRLQTGHAVSMWVIDVWFSEIRQTPPAQMSSNGQTGTAASPTNTGDPQLQGQQNGGQVQPQGVDAGGLPPGAFQYSQVAGQTAAPPPVVPPGN